MTLCVLSNRITMSIERNETNLIVDTLPLVTGDNTMIRQFLQNIIGNAIKFSGKKNDSEVHVYGEVTADEIIIHVKDNGIGIPEDSNKDIFGVFQRLHSDKSYQGQGIGCLSASGLWIVIKVGFGIPRSTKKA